MMTHPEILHAIKSANAAVGKLPRKWLVCSWQVHREIKEYYESDEYEGYAFYRPPAPQKAVNVYGPLGGVEINVYKGWEGRKWRLCTKAQRDYIFDEELRGRRGEETWSKEKHVHTCCNSRVWYRHKRACPRLAGNEKWKALT